MRRNARSSSSFALAVGAVALFLLGSTLLVAAPANALAVNPSVTIQETTTAASYDTALDTFYHNSSASNQSHAVSFPVNITGYTSIQSFAFLLTSAAGPWVPQIVVTQGTTVIFNATVSSQVVINPEPSAVPVTVNTVTLFNVSGGATPLGTYKVWDNVSETVQMTDAVPAGWSLSGIVFSLSATVTATYGYWFNSTQVLFPYPSGVQVNYSSAKAAPGTYARGYAGIYAYNTTLASTGSVTVTASFQPVPVNSGPAVFVTLTKARLIPGTLNTWTAFGNWTDNLGLPYIGIYVLLISFNGYVLDPSSVVVTETPSTTGLPVTANPASYSVDPSDVAVLPNNLLVGVGASVAFQLNFSSLESPPTGSLTPTSVLLAIPGFPITLALLLEIAMGVTAVYASLSYRIYRRQGPAKVRAVITDLVFIEISLVAFLVLSTLF